MADARRTRAPRPELADALAREIQAGLLPPGAWLKQIDLERRFGAKRLDVRRALDRLVLRRLVQHERNRGYRVYQRDEGQSAEIQEVRAILETAAVDGVVGAASESDFDALGALAAGFSELVRTGTVLQQYEANLAFHARLVGLCPNRELVALIGEMRARGPSAPLSQWRTQERVERSAREHEMMVEALRARDADGLRAIVGRHIRQPETG